jgi:hypothetical protein
VALSDTEIELLDKHKRLMHRNQQNDILLERYYQGRQRVEQLGMAVPPSMRNFLVIANWCRVVVDTINNRQQVRSLILPGEETADPDLRAIWDANNLTAHVRMFNADRMIYGRSFMSVGTNEENGALPFVRVESPREMTAFVDTYRETMTSAARFYGRNEQNVAPSNATLYLPNVTVWAEIRDGRWAEVDRDEHDLGAVPVVMHLNRRMSGGWVGESQMTDIIPFVDSAARSLTNLQFAQEAHGVPSIWATGVTKGDFVDGNGKPIPQFEAYFDAIKILTSKDAKWGQFDAADLKNFDTALNVYGKQASITSGFPARYFGIITSNPPAEGAIRADEAPLVRSVEAQNDEVGMTLGWIGGLALRFATGDWVEGNRVRVDWFDPSTPTVSQREDALAKRRAAGVLSREGYWDELGWSEARKAKERAYFEAEQRDPLIERALRRVDADADVRA